MEIKVDVKREAENISNLVKLAGKDILISELRDKYDKLSQEELFLNVKKLHEGNEDGFARVKSHCESLWESIGEGYMKEMGEIIGHDLDNDKNVYIVGSLWVNIADVIGGKNAFIIAEETQQNPLDFILLHELTHLHYADVLDRLGLDEAGKSSLMEGVAHLIMFKTPIKKLFDSIKYSDVDFIKANPDFMDKLEKLWNNRVDIESFLKDAIDLDKKTDGVVIC